MAEIIIADRGGELTIDSRLIAELYEVEHASIRKIVKRHREQFEVFGLILSESIFANETTFNVQKCGSENSGHAVQKGGRPGRPEEIYFLNENQTALLLTFTQNTAKAVALKVKLIQAFHSAKESLKQQTNTHPSLSPEKQKLIELDQLHARTERKLLKTK